MMTNFTKNMIKVPLCDGYNVRGRWWRGDERDARGAVLYLHGIQSHGLWFEESAAAIAEAGFDVLLADRRGSGLNSNRGDVDNYKRWLSDQIELVNWICEQSKVSKVHIVGVSWGGKLAVGLAKLIPDKIASLTLIAPGIFPAVDVAKSVKLQIGLSAAVRSKKQFLIPLSEAELFTDNPIRQEFIKGDELKLSRVTGNFLYQSRRLDFFVRCVNQRLTMPIKLFLAGHERIINNKATLDYFRSLRCDKVKEFSYYPLASHTLEFENDNSDFINDLTDWLGRMGK